jgi:ribonuclease BN (tRNA processing enzyme)
MKLHILGCGDAFGSGGRNQSAYLVEAGESLFLLDCGPTTLLAMKRGGHDPRRLDAVILSHLHGDHFAGLPFLFIQYLYLQPRDRPLMIAGPPGTADRVTQLHALMYGSGGQLKELPAVRYIVLTPGQTQMLDGLEVFPFRVTHQTDDISLGLKVAYGNKRLLFSGDAAWSDEFLEHARGVDLFLCECSFFEPQPAMHVNYRALESRLNRLECKKLLLTHLGEDMLARRSEIIPATAEDGMVVEL